MAGKKGMKQARPRTQEERDKYALARIEELLDSVALDGKNMKTWNPIRMRAIEIRYNKLRATLASTELTDKREGWIDVMKRLSESPNVVKEQRISESAAEQEQPITSGSNTTH